MKKGLFFLILALSLCIYTCDDNTKPNQPPIVVIAADPLSGAAPLTVVFSSSAEDADGVIAGYSWNFGDGIGSSTEQNPTYAYNSLGTFTATCTVRDNGTPPLTATATVAVTVYQSKIPALSSISPEWSVIHMPEFTLTVTGTDFFPDSKIIFNDNVMSTVYISSTQLTCQIKPDDTVLSAFLKSDGSLDLQVYQYANVYVHNPGIGGGDSGMLNFTVRPNHIFDSPTLVSPSSYQDSWGDPRLLKGQHLFVAYYDGTTAYNSDFIFTRASQDSGKTWGIAYQTPIYPTMWSEVPIVAGMDGILYVSQEEYLYKSTDDGKTWSDPILISVGTPDEGCYEYWNQDYNLIRLNDGTLYSAWMESKADVCIPDFVYLGSWIVHCSSKDGGLTWSGISKIPNPAGVSPHYFYPSLFKTLSGKIHYFYASGCCSPQFPDGYAHITSTDGGASWTTPVDMQSFTGSLYNSPVVGDEEGLYIPDRTVGASSQEISVKYWLDGAPSWGRTPAAISLGLSQTVRMMSVSVDTAGNINLFYTRGPNESGYAVYYQRSIDLGRNWTTPIRISPLGCTIGGNSHVCGAVGNLFVIWESVNDPHPIYFTSSERNSD